MTSILRYEVPVDGDVHRLPVGIGDIVHVDSRDPRIVEFWIHDFGLPEANTIRAFTVIGTGHAIPVGRVIGTALTPAGDFPGTPRGRLVWHLVEVYGDTSDTATREAAESGDPVIDLLTARSRTPLADQADRVPERLLRGPR